VKSNSIVLSNNRLTGPMPSGIGNLESLGHLYVDRTDLSGPLPREMLGLSLTGFHWHSTDLCAPTDSEFRQWLASIARHTRGRDCDPGEG